MKLILSPAFVRAAKKLLRRNPELTSSVRETLKLLEEDMSHPRLKSHKLKGELEGAWACKVVYDVRIIFREVVEDGESALLLRTIGSHDDVY